MEHVGRPLHIEIDRHGDGGPLPGQANQRLGRTHQQHGNNDQHQQAIIQRHQDFIDHDLIDQRTKQGQDFQRQSKAENARQRSLQPYGLADQFG
ncbi:hypothetical protein D3C80_1392410 [compost metagenome]